MGTKNSLLFKVARRWIAGTDVDTAIDDAKKANSRGYGAVLNFLGEEIRDPAIADSHADQYLKLQDAINSNGIRGFASAKPTQLGLGADETAARVRLEKLAANAERLNQMLYLDMEGSRFTTRTLDLYTGLHESHPETGVALQAYLRRSQSDLKALLDKGGRVRLVKGAYREPATLEFPTKAEVRKNYVTLMKMLFDGGDKFAIATHDSKLVNEAQRLAGSKHATFEFEMLKGIRDELKDELVKSGYRVSEYLPYGDQWMAYSRRRLSEHPSNILLLLRSLV